VANPTQAVPVDSIPFDEEKVYWPADSTLTSDTTYNGEMMGMKLTTGYANHFDDSTPMLFLGTKEQITSRFQSDTPATDFKYLIRRPKFFEINLNTSVTATAAIPNSIGLPAYAADSGHVQLSTSGLNNNNFVGMVVDIGRSASTGGTGGILTLTGATSVMIAPPQWGALLGLIVAPIPGYGTAGAAAPGQSITTGAGAASTATSGTAAGGAGSTLTITTGAGGACSSTGAAAGGAAGSLTFTLGVGGTAAGTSAAGAGGGVTLTLGAGGANSSSGNGGAGGSFTLTAGAGGTTASGTAGAAGTVSVTSGTGAAQTASASASAGGAWTLAGGTGGAGTATGTGAKGGAVTITGGTGGSTSGAGTAGNGGNLAIDAGPAGTESGGTAGIGGVTIISDANAQATYLNRGPLKALQVGIALGGLGTTQSSTPTAAQLLGGLITQTGATGAGTVTLPSGTALSAACARTPVVGDSFDCWFINVGGAETLTITGATGTTVSGTVAVGSGKFAVMKFYNTGANTWNIYCIVSA